MFVAGLLLVDTADWPAMIVAVNLVNLGLNLCAGTSLSLSLLFSLANSVQAVSGAYFFRRFIAPTTRLTAMKEFLGLVVCTVFIGTTLGAALGGMALMVSGYGNSYLALGESWWRNNSMAILLMAPSRWSGFRPLRGEGHRGRGRGADRSKPP